MSWRLWVLPGIAGLVLILALVSLHDLAATFLEYAGATPPSATDSRPLRGVLESQTGIHRKHVISGLGDWRMVFDGQHKLVSRRDQPGLLFDRQHDPNEMHDIAARHPAAMKRLTTVLTEYENPAP